MLSNGNRKRHKSGHGGGGGAAAGAAGSQGGSLPADSQGMLPAPVAELALGLDSHEGSDEDDHGSSGLGALLEAWPSDLISLGGSSILTHDDLQQLPPLSEAAAASGKAGLPRSSSTPQLPPLALPLVAAATCVWGATAATAGGSLAARRPPTPVGQGPAQDSGAPPPAAGRDLLPEGDSPTAPLNRDQLLKEALRRQRDMQQQLAASLEVRGLAVTAGVYHRRLATHFCSKPPLSTICIPHSKRRLQRLRLRARLHAMKLTSCAPSPDALQAQRALQLQLEAHGRYIEELLK